MTKYARDEFDRVPETSTRQGVHRTVSATRSRRLGPVLSFGAAALAVGLFAFLLLPRLGFGPAVDSAVAADQTSSSAPASPAPTTAAASAPASTPSSVPAGSLAPAASGPSTAAAPSAAAVDKTQPVAIYNGTTTAGLAGRAGTTLTSAGWVLGPLGNWGGARQQASVVFYNGPEQKANAAELGTLLGITTLVDSADFNMPLVVVLGPGFK